MGHPSGNTARRFKGGRYETYRRGSQEGWGKGHSNWERPQGWGGRWVSEFVSQTLCHTNTAAPLLSANRLVCCEWAIAPAQQEASPQRASPVSEHLVPIKLLISLSSATALGWFHPAHGSVSSGQLELPCSLLGPPTGHPGHQLATHYSIIAGNSEVSSLTVWQCSSGTTETPKQIKAFIIFAFTKNFFQKIKLNLPNVYFGKNQKMCFNLLIKSVFFLLSSKKYKALLSAAVLRCDSWFWSLVRMTLLHKFNQLSCLMQNQSQSEQQ